MICPICSASIAAGASLCQDCRTTINRVERKVKATEQGLEVRTGASLCASVEGYIRLCEILPLSEVGALAKEYLERILPLIQVYGGQLNWYNAEKIVAYFGLANAPDVRPAAVCAVAAAVNMHQVFAEFCNELIHSYASDLELDLRIGIASGNMLRGTLGDAALERPSWSSRSNRLHPDPAGRARRFRRIVIGDVVNLSVQLEYEARPGHILTDSATREVASSEFEFVSLGQHYLRRRSSPVEVFSVVGPRSGPAALTWRTLAQPVEI